MTLFNKGERFLVQQSPAFPCFAETARASCFQFGDSSSLLNGKAQDTQKRKMTVLLNSTQRQTQRHHNTSRPCF